MFITAPEIEQYMHSLLLPRNELMREMEDWAEEQNFPIIGPLVGNLLAQFAASIDARRVMELGSGFGYSALWFASALSDDAHIICTDHSERNRERALVAFDRVALNNQIEFHCGDALDIFSKTEGEFDIIFCDIDKHEYPEAFLAAFPRLRIGGYLFFDNVLWKGRILENDQSKDTKGVKELNRLAFSQAGCHATIIPLRDGVLACRKFGENN